MTDTNTVASLPDWAQKMISDLRSEAAENRQAAKTAETERDTLRDELTGIHSKTALDGLKNVLADPDDLARYVDTAELVGEDGKPDPAKYLDAAKTLTSERPHLGRRIGSSGTEVRGARRHVETEPDPAAQAAAGAADFVALVQGGNP